MEQFLPRGFEWLSVSYRLTECLMLAIYRSMQKQGLMSKEGRTQSYTVNVLLTIFLLLFANFIRVITMDTSPAMYVIFHIVVLMIYLGILVSWGLSVYDRIVNTKEFEITIAEDGKDLIYSQKELVTVGEQKIKISYKDAFEFFIVTVVAAPTTEPTNPTDGTEATTDGSENPTDGTESTAPTTGTTDKNDGQNDKGMPWWGILLIALAAAGAGVGITVVVLKKKK